jgi:hypothetical protein
LPRTEVTLPVAIALLKSRRLNMSEKEFHVLIVTRRKDGSSAVYNYVHDAENRFAIFNYFLKRFDPEEIETLTILEEREA